MAERATRQPVRRGAGVREACGDERVCEVPFRPRDRTSQRDFAFWSGGEDAVVLGNHERVAAQRDGYGPVTWAAGSGRPVACDKLSAMDDVRLRLEGAYEILEQAFVRYRALSSSIDSWRWRRRLVTLRERFATFHDLEPAVLSALEKARALAERDRQLTGTKTRGLLDEVLAERERLRAAIGRRLAGLAVESPPTLAERVAVFIQVTSPSADIEPLVHLSVRGRWQRRVSASAAWLWLPATFVMNFLGIEGSTPWRLAVAMVFGLPLSVLWRRWISDPLSAAWRSSSAPGRFHSGIC